jgi:hypothetical protein
MIRLFKLAFMCVLLTVVSAAQNKETWNWDVETIVSDGRFTSVVTDADSNIYVSYIAPDGVKFAYRPVGRGQKWYVMPVGNDLGFTSIALDPKSNPYICFNGHGSLFVAQLVNHEFQVQPIAPQTGTLAYSCAIAISKEGVPSVSWYHEKTPDGVNYLHFKYAELKGGAWRARTVDFDMQTGKWHSMKIDPAGRVLVVYDGYVNGQIKLAAYDGTKWDVQLIDTRVAGSAANYNLGMGNSFALDAKGKPHVAYYTTSELRYAVQDESGHWKVQKVDSVSPSGAWLGYRSATVVDAKGDPHIFYQDLGALKHAYRQDGVWKYQLIVGTGEGDPYQYQSATLDASGRIILVFRDPSGSGLKAAAGTFGVPGTAAPATASTGSPAAAAAKPVTAAPKKAKSRTPVNKDKTKNPDPEKK